MEKRIKWLLDMWQERRNNLLIDLESSPNSQILRANARLYELDKCIMDVKEYFDLVLNTPPEPHKDEHGWVSVKDMLPRWISVEEKLPEEEGQYIVTTKFGIKISSFSNNLYKLDKYDFADYKGKQRKGFYNYDSEYGYFEQDILAWMPTPEPYREDEE